MNTIEVDYKLTDEQKLVVESTAEKTRVIAYAGAAKTTCLIEFAKARPNNSFLNLAYNRSIRDENKNKFGSNTSVMTTHQLAFATVGREYKNRIGNLTYFDAKEILNTQNWRLTKDSLDVLRSFYSSADKQIHIGHFEGVTVPAPSSKAKRYYKFVLECATLLWKAQDDINGRCKVEHDFYLKKYFLTSSHLVASRYDYFLIDEFQDTTPAFLAFLKNCNLPMVAVLDPYQQVYRWRGAIDAGEDSHFQDDKTETLRLTMSFRFGKKIAAVANDLLTLLGERVPLVGYKETDVVSQKIPEDINLESKTITYLHRTVIGTIETAIEMAANKRKTFWVGGIDSYDIPNIKDVCYLSLGELEKIENRKLKKRFPNFSYYREYSEETGDLEAKRSVRLIDRYTDEGLLKKLDGLNKWVVEDEFEALSILSTIHRSKGLEWDWVKLADMTEYENLIAEKGEEEEEWQYIKDELHLYYVAATRAIEGLVLDGNLLILRDIAKQYRDGITDLALPNCWLKVLGLEPNKNQKRKEKAWVLKDVKKTGDGENGRGLSETQYVSYQLFREGESTKDIAVRRSLKEQTIIGHLANAIRNGLLTTNEVLDIAESEIMIIEKAIADADVVNTRSIKPVYECFEGKYQYGDIKCVLASVNPDVQIN